MPNHRRKPLKTIGSWHDVTLHDISDITTIEEYEDTRQHALREDAGFDMIDYRLLTIIDNTYDLNNTSESLSGDDIIRYVVFDAAYTSLNTVNHVLEQQYRDSVFDLVVDRVVRRHIDDSCIHLATIVGGTNITTTGDSYIMQPALHLLVNGTVEKALLVDMVTDIYDYMAVHGYIITGEPSDFLIDLK